jgi:cell division septal protein FtsQ
MSGRGAWQLETSEGILIQLGQEAQRERLAYWIELYPGLKASRPQEFMRSVDMCYGNGMAVFWQPAAATLPAQAAG